MSEGTRHLAPRHQSAPTHPTAFSHSLHPIRTLGDSASDVRKGSAAAIGPGGGEGVQGSPHGMSTPSATSMKKDWHLNIANACHLNFALTYRIRIRYLMEPGCCILLDEGPFLPSPASEACLHKMPLSNSQHRALKGRALVWESCSPLPSPGSLRAIVGEAYIGQALQRRYKALRHRRPPVERGAGARRMFKRLVDSREVAKVSR